jgi:hypothetical protein
MITALETFFGKARQRVMLTIHFTAKDNFAFRVEHTDLDEPLVNIESHITSHGRSPISGQSGLLDMASVGPIGNYLFELEAQPGGPQGGQLKNRARSP